MRKLRSSLFLFYIFSLSIFSQNVTDLKKQRLKTVADIESTNKLLEEKSQNKKVLLTNVTLLSSQITARERIISNVAVEIEQLDRELSVNELKLQEISHELETSKSNYEFLLVHAYTRRFKYDMLMFMLSSDNLSTAYNRYLLLRDFSYEIRREGDNLIRLKAQQEALLSNVKGTLLQKQDVHETLEHSSKALSKEKSTKEILIKDLEKEEKWLRAELKKKERLAKALDDQIRAAIEAEAKKAAKTSGSKPIIPSEFAKAKGKLEWPVKGGVVTSFFGEHDHPVIKSLKIKNNGIDIEVPKRSSVKTVFKGQVSKIIAIPGYNMAVLIRHGNYLTVYANLEKVQIATGDNVFEGDVIGTLFGDSEETRSFLHFEIWRESEKLDPILWLSSDK